MPCGILFLAWAELTDDPLRFSFRPEVSRTSRVYFLGQFHVVTVSCWLGSSMLFFSIINLAFVAVSVSGVDRDSASSQSFSAKCR